MDGPSGVLVSSEPCTDLTLRDPCLSVLGVERRQGQTTRNNV